MTISFVVPRKPISPNAGYIRAGFGKNRGPKGGVGLILTQEARDFKDAVKAHAFAAARSAGWPKPHLVKSVSVVITTWNTRHDADSACKFVLDSMQGVIYENDRCVQRVLAAKARDKAKPRVEVCVFLDEVKAA